MNLMDGIQAELSRARELLAHYRSIPTVGFETMVVSKAIDAAEECIENGDPVGMIQAYNNLKCLK